MYWNKYESNFEMSHNNLFDNYYFIILECVISSWSLSCSHPLHVNWCALLIWFNLIFFRDTLSILEVNIFSHKSIHENFQRVRITYLSDTTCKVLAAHYPILSVWSCEATMHSKLRVEDICAMTSTRDTIINDKLEQYIWGWVLTIRDIFSTCEHHLTIATHARMGLRTVTSSMASHWFGSSIRNMVFGCFHKLVTPDQWNLGGLNVL